AKIRCLSPVTEPYVPLYWSLSPTTNRVSLSPAAEIGRRTFCTRIEKNDSRLTFSTRLMLWRVTFPSIIASFRNGRFDNGRCRTLQALTPLPSENQRSVRTGSQIPQSIAVSRIVEMSRSDHASSLGLPKQIEKPKPPLHKTFPT